MTGNDFAIYLITSVKYSDKAIVDHLTASLNPIGWSDIFASFDWLIDLQIEMFWRTFDATQAFFVYSLVSLTHHCRKKKILKW